MSPGNLTLTKHALKMLYPPSHSTTEEIDADENFTEADSEVDELRHLEIGGKLGLLLLAYILLSLSLVNIWF